MRLDRHAGECERPRIAELAVDRSRIVTAARGFEEAASGFEDDGRRGEPELRELGRDHAAFARAPGVEGLHHGAEIFAQSRGLARGDAQRAPRLLDVEAEQLRDARAGGDGADRGRAVKAVLIVARVHRFGELGFDFHRDLISGEHVAPGAAVALADRQHRRQCRRRRMGEQPVDAVLGDGKLGVVVVVGMDRNAVGERGEARGHFHAGADDRAAFGDCAAERAQMLAHDMARLGNTARECQSDAVENGAFAEVHHVGGNVVGARARDEFGDVGGERWVCAAGHCGVLFESATALIA